MRVKTYSTIKTEPDMEWRWVYDVRSSKRPRNGRSSEAFFSCVPQLNVDETGSRLPGSRRRRGGRHIGRNFSPSAPGRPADSPGLPSSADGRLVQPECGEVTPERRTLLHFNNLPEKVSLTLLEKLTKVGSGCAEVFAKHTLF